MRADRRRSGVRTHAPADDERARARGPGPAAPTWTGDLDAAVATTEGDTGNRIAAMQSINESAGNRAAGKVVQMARSVQREDDDNPHQDAGYTLANARFAGNKRLQEIAGGGSALGKSDKATAVKPVQTALLDLGYTLLLYKDDGSFGAETTQAISQFRADRGVTGGDGMDANALRRLDQLAPAPGKQEEHYLDYSKLFADGKLDVTLAIGYDEGQSQYKDLDSARDWMGKLRLTKTSPAAPPKPAPGPGAPDVISGASPVEDPNIDARKGISTPEVWSGKRQVTYPDASGKRVTREITVTITLVPPGTGAKASFEKGLNESEVTLYSGHARRGIGPDFDADKSPYENFVIGVGSALHKAGRVKAAGAAAESHYVLEKKNDLEAMKGKWDPEKYRVWFFNACSSIAYIDELRGGLLPEKMNRHMLDLFGTNQVVPIAAGLTPVFENLEGILAGQTMEEIVRRMQKATSEALNAALDKAGYSEKDKARVLKEYSGEMFLREGAGDNAVAATP